VTIPPRLAHPFLKSVGGKRQLLPQIFPLLPARFRRYHEPFLGGGALFFALANAGRLAKGATLSDVNERTVRAWRGVRDDVEGVIRELGTYRYDRDLYYTARARPIGRGTDTEVAAWRIYISKAGFNGLYRENRAGQCNTPFGRYTNPTICDADGLRVASAALQDVDIRLEDFRTAFARASRGDFMYLDPPYVPLTETACFTSYTAGGFTWEDQRRLCEEARAAKARGVKVLLSNSAAPAVVELYQGFHVTEVSARRAVSCHSETRGPVRELLIA
jgi:DNA adenine methylase